MKKILVLAVFALGGCASWEFPNETPIMKAARGETYAQIRYADIAQSYLNNPQTSIQSLMGWKKEDKIKMRDANIKGCLANTRLYNKHAGKVVLDEERCYPFCYSKDPKVCFEGHYKW